MSAEPSVVQLRMADGRLTAEHVPEKECSDRVREVGNALDAVLRTWAERCPGGYAVPSWEEAFRDTLHSVSRPTLEREAGEISLSPFGRVFVRSSMAEERTAFRTRCAGQSPDAGLWSGDIYSFYRYLNRQEWGFLLDRVGKSFEVARPISALGVPATPWIQTDGGAVNRTSDSPFRALARFQYDAFARPSRTRAIMKDRELLLLAAPSSIRHGLLSLHGAFTEVALPLLRYESLLRVKDILGLTDEMILNYASEESPLELQVGDQSGYSLCVNHPLQGRLCWGDVEVPFRFFLGADTELHERHTFQTLWKLYGLPGMTLEVYLQLRRKGVLVNQG